MNMKYNNNIIYQENVQKQYEISPIYLIKSYLVKSIYFSGERRTA